MDNDLTLKIGKEAGTLSLVEIGLGSVIHSFKIPLGGHLLSLNQIAILSRSSFTLKSPQAPLTISLIAALLKTLSPAGKKLTPMLALSAQGLFFSLAMNIFGVNYLGLIFAVFLASLWAFIQPVLFIFLLFGKTSLDVTNYFILEIEKLLPHAEKMILWLVVILIVVKFIVAFILSLMAINMSQEEFGKMQNFFTLQIQKKESSSKNPFSLALKDLFSPLFIFSLILTCLFFIFSHASFAQSVWVLLRPMALGFILFYFIRKYPLDHVTDFLKSKGFDQFSKSLEQAILIIKNNKKDS